MPRHALLATLAVLAAVTLAGCATAPGPTTEVGVSGVEFWPQYGDFLVEGNKAVIPANNLRLDGDDETADYLMRIAATPQARWIGDFMDDTRVRNLANSLFRASEEQGTIALIAYAGDPGAECGVTPQNEVAQFDAYVERTQTLADPFASYDAQAWVVFEPGAMTSLGDCAGQGDRLGMMTRGVEILADAGMTLYVDAGGPGVLTVGEAAERLALLPLDRVAGVALNVADYQSNEAVAAYGEELVAQLADAGFPGLGYVIDSSRNGLPLDGPGGCNPPGVALGNSPRIVDDLSAAAHLRAFLWVKRPGESDGPCNGGIEQGQFQLAFALELARNGDPSAA